MYKRKAESQEIPYEGERVSKVLRSPEQKAVSNSSPSRMVMFVNESGGPVSTIFSYGTLVDHAQWASANTNLRELYNWAKAKLPNYELLRMAAMIIERNRQAHMSPKRIRQALARKYRGTQEKLCSSCKSDLTTPLVFSDRFCYSCDVGLRDLVRVGQGMLHIAMDKIKYYSDVLPKNQQAKALALLKKQEKIEAERRKQASIFASLRGTKVVIDLTTVD